MSRSRFLIYPIIASSGNSLGQYFLQREDLFARVLTWQGCWMRDQLMEHFSLAVASCRGEGAVAAPLGRWAEWHGVHPQGREEGRGAETEQQLHDLHTAPGRGQLQGRLGAVSLIVLHVHAPLNTRP